MDNLLSLMRNGKVGLQEMGLGRIVNTMLFLSLFFSVTDDIIRSIFN